MGQEAYDENPTKNYTHIGIDTVIDQMEGKLFHTTPHSDKKNWPELISLATPIINQLIEIAGQSNRNIILDQTNVSQRARRTKANVFRDYGTRRCVTIVNKDETLAQRTEKREREEGRYVPVEAVNEMRANFSIPTLDDGFTKLEWPELTEFDALPMILKSRSKAWFGSDGNC